MLGGPLKSMCLQADWLPPPLSYCAELFHLVTSNDLYLLMGAISNFIKVRNYLTYSKNIITCISGELARPENRYSYTAKRCVLLCFI